MPVMDGFAAAERLKAEERTRGVPIVFLTALTQDSDLARGRELGAAAYVTKPFDVADIADLVINSDTTIITVTRVNPIGGAPFERGYPRCG